MLRPLEVERVPETREQLKDLLRRPLGATGLATAAAVAFFGGASDIPIPIFDLLAAFTAVAAASGTYFNVVDHVARGKRGFPAPAEADGWSPRTLALRGLLCAMVLVTPFGLWLAANHGAESVRELVVTRPLGTLVVAAVAVAWLVAALLAVLASVSGLAAFWPPALVTVVARDPARYGKLLALVASTGAACVALGAALFVATGRVPYLSTFVGWGAASLGLFAQAALVGGFVHRNRELYTVR